MEIVLHPRCPECARSMIRKGRPKRGEQLDESVSIEHFWKCSFCGYQTRSVEWRPLGENACCYKRLHEKAWQGRQNRPWRKEGNLLRRSYSWICPDCGESYIWEERLVLGVVE